MLKLKGTKGVVNYKQPTGEYVGAEKLPMSILNT